jgi:hypothetical protein
MRAIIAWVLLASTVASAQPGPDDPPPPPPGAVPMPYAYQPAPPTAEERALLERGEISSGARSGGGLLALFLGFGSGQAVQGRFAETGWIFLVGEGLSGAAFTKGVVDLIECTADRETTYNCDNARWVPWLVGGSIAFSVFRIWGVVDAFKGPERHNQRVRAVKARLGIPIYAAPYVAPSHDRATFGVVARF